MNKIGSIEKELCTNLTKIINDDFEQFIEQAFGGKENITKLLSKKNELLTKLEVVE